MKKVGQKAGKVEFVTKETVNLILSQKYNFGPPLLQAFTQLYLWVLYYIRLNFCNAFLYLPLIQLIKNFAHASSFGDNYIIIIKYIIDARARPT